MSYPGGKSASGVYQTLINLMPRHNIYIEPFLGGAAIMQRKRPARWSIGIDADGRVLTPLPGIPNLHLVQADAVIWLYNIAKNVQTITGLSGVGHDRLMSRDTLIYLDPPYLMDTRSSKRAIYKYEMSDAHHERLLRVITGLQCMVMISGYPSEMYDSALYGWRRITYRAMTRSGEMATEVVWCNFAAPAELHDYRYLGGTYRERERIKRKVNRWKSKVRNLDPLERAAILEALDATTPPPPAILQSRERYADLASPDLAMPAIAATADTGAYADTGHLHF